MLGYVTQQFVERTPLYLRNVGLRDPKLALVFQGRAVLGATCLEGELSGAFLNLTYQHKFTRMGMGIYRPRWQDTEAFFYLPKL